jgi:hypothetical protein
MGLLQKAGDWEVSRMCACYDGAIWEGDLDDVAGQCYSDIIEVTGHFEEMPSGSGSNYSRLGGADSVDLM